MCMTLGPSGGLSAVEDHLFLVDAGGPPLFRACVVVSCGVAVTMSEMLAYGLQTRGVLMKVQFGRDVPELVG
jgi:hypothetical protein